MTASKSTVRRADRAKARQGEVWSWVDRGLMTGLAMVILCAIFAPALVADIGDTVVGSAQVVPALGISYSGLLLVFARWLPVMILAYALWYVREAPWQARIGWVLVSTGVLMNFARNVFTGNPATLSFLVLDAGLILLAWRLCTRPTIWETLGTYRQRAEDAEARADRAEARGRGE